MEAVAPQIHVELVRLHRAGRLGVGDEERLLVGRARERNAAHLAHGAARAVASGHPRGGDVARGCRPAA